MDWNECLTIARTMNDHYSLLEAQQEIVYKYATQLPKGAKMVELGVCNGKTASVMIYVAHYMDMHYTGIDNYSLENTEEEVRKRLNAIGFAYELIKANTESVIWTGGPIDLLLIDGGHQESAVKPDCEKWIPLVRAGGYVIFHDFDEPELPGSAHWAVRKYGNDWTGTWETKDFYKGLMVRQKPMA